MLNSWFKHGWSRHWTWRSNDNKTKRCLDYVMCEAVFRQYTTNCRVHCAADFETDHRLLVTTARTRRPRIERYRPHRPKRTVMILARFRISRLKLQSLRSRLPLPPIQCCNENGVFPGARQFLRHQHCHGGGGFKHALVSRSF